MTVKVIVRCEDDEPPRARLPEEVEACLANLAGLVDTQADHEMREADLEEELERADAMVSDRPSLEHLQQMVARAGHQKPGRLRALRKMQQSRNENASSIDFTMGDGLCGDGDGAYYPMGCLGGKLCGPGRGECQC